MFRARRRTVSRPPFIPPLLVMGTAALLSLAAAQLAVAAPLFKTSTASDCSTPSAAARAVARHVGAAPGVGQRFDARGEFAGRQLVLAGRSTAISLPAESYVAQPVGDALVYTISVAGRSEVHLLDLGSGCDAMIATPPGVTRSAILDPSGTVVYVHGVSYPARVDAGVTRYALNGSSVQQVVPALPDDSRFGLNFGTQLGWSTDGSALFVQSCAIVECRTRLLDVGSSLVKIFDADGQGPIVGVTGHHLVSYGACDGLPCSVIGVDRGTGAATTLADEAWAATLAGDTVRITTSSGTIEVAQ